MNERYPISDQCYVRPATREDVNVIAKDMRPADVAEVEAASGLSPGEALFEAWDATPEPWTFVVKEHPTAMFGVVPGATEYPRHGVIWMLGTPRIGKVPVSFLRGCKQWLNRIADRYEAVGNWVDCRNLVSIGFLDRLGFEFAPAETFGVEQRPFLPFSKITHTSHV